jgi:DNA polymerase III delta subunit
VNRAAPATAPVARFILLAGDDATSRLAMKNGIVDSHRSAHPDAPVERYDPETGSFIDFTENIATPSLLYPLRIFVIDDVHLLGEADLDRLLALTSCDLPDARVIMESEKARGKRGRDAAVSKKYGAFLEALSACAERDPGLCGIMEFVKPPDYKMAEWVEDAAGRFVGRRIGRQDAEYLVDLVGTDTALLHSELQKIDLYLPDGAAIDRAAIDGVAQGARLATQFELAESLGRKKFDRTLELIESIFVSTPYLPLYVSGIFRHFWALFRLNRFGREHPDILRQFKSAVASYNKAAQEKPGLAIGVAAGLMHENQRSSIYPVLIKSGVVDQALSYTPAQYRRIFALLAEYDRGLKTGRIDDSKTTFELFCFKIMRADLLSPEPV